MNKLKTVYQLFHEFGVKYLFLRFIYEFKKKIGLLKMKFPSEFLENELPNLNDWRRKYGNNFIIPSKDELFLDFKVSDEELTNQVERILQGEIPFFSSSWKYLGFENEWNIHPESKFVYPLKHWTQIPIYSKTIGDIKFVWEKSKFSYLLFIMRFDARFNKDHSEFVFKEIERWIDENPPNMGPQYVCSQEISVRLINWSFFLFFYQKSNYLTEILFNKILKSIEIQFHHVYHNISFSRSFVRNNHAITETLTLYLISLYFPFFKDSNLFGKKGKKWFEQEVLFQLFNDGSDSQYSFNYHRVKVQLFTLALASAKLHNQTFSDAVIKKMKSSLFFLTQMIGDTINGYLPNFGANDGSLYFKLNGKDYRNYLPQLYALAGLLEIKLNFIIETAGIEEDLIWYTSKIKLDIRQEIQMQEYNYFPDGGYITCRLNNFFVVFKTPEYKFRIGQDDYFHLDVWCDNVNLLRDSGSFKYNTDPKTFNNFNGVIGHNTISINMENHLKKSFGFVWLNKPKHNSTNISYKDGILKFSSSMNVITPIKALISRSVELNTRKRELIVTDSCYPDNKTKLDNSLIQIWNCDSENFYKLGFKSNSDKSNLITPQIVDGQCSVYYGKSLATKRVLIENNCTELKTIISFY